VEYNAELDMNDGEKDPYLLTLMHELEKLAKLDDVRPYLDEQYKIR
jgi:hypothetical protein